MRHFVSYRVVIAGAVAVSLLQSLAATSGAAAEAPTLRLGSTTTVSADTSTRWTVRLDAPAAIDVSLIERGDGLMPAALGIAGVGDFVGVVLNEQGRTDGAFAVALRVPHPLVTDNGVARGMGWGQPAVADREPELVPLLPGYAPQCQRCTLPAGLYDLTLIADGAPIEATITMEGLAGRVDLVADDGVPTLTHQPDPHVSTATTTELLNRSGGAIIHGFGHRSARHFGLLINHAGFEFEAENLAPNVVTLSHCRGDASSQMCFDRQFAGRTGRAGGSYAVPVVYGLGDEADSYMGFDLEFAATYSAFNEVLLVPLGRVAGAPADSGTRLTTSIR